MKFSFDLISDLHVAPDEEFDWSGQQTALYAILVGDIARDRTTAIEVIRHISQLYLGVFVIDGNDEHRDFYDDIDLSYQDYTDELGKIPGVVYLQNNVVILNDVAIVGTNGWWTYSFNPQLDFNQSIEWFMEYTDVTQEIALEILDRAYHDAAYLVNSVKRLQTHHDIKSIIIATHTLPMAKLAIHDTSISDSFRFNCLGNQHLQAALGEDHANKIKLWCFGHYHLSIDQEFDDVRYVSNPRGRQGTPWFQSAYFPKRIDL